MTSPQIAELKDLITIASADEFKHETRELAEECIVIALKATKEILNDPAKFIEKFVKIAMEAEKIK